MGPLGLQIAYSEEVEGEEFDFASSYVIECSA
jgi:hypothetical protein